MTGLRLFPAAAIGVLSFIAMVQTAAAASPVPCSGDEAACQNINIEQRGTDQQSGAHFVMSFQTEPGKVSQVMNLTLSIAQSSDSCASATETLANLNPGDPRSIDGYLCSLRATYERR